MNVGTMDMCSDALPKLITPARWRLIEMAVRDPLLCRELSQETGIDERTLYREVTDVCNSMRRLVEPL